MGELPSNYVEFQCPKCAIWFPSPITFERKSLKVLHGLQMRCPCCFECFIFDEEFVRFSSEEDIFRDYQEILNMHKK